MYLPNTIYNTEELCKFCEREDETFDHLLNGCPCFYLERCEILKNQPVQDTLDWTLDQLLQFANIDTIKDALSYNPYNASEW